MSSNPLNDLSKVYLDQIANFKKAENEADIQRWEEIGGPTPTNYKPTGTSAKIRTESVSRSDWRNDIFEAGDPDATQTPGFKNSKDTKKKIKEVSGINNTVVINPKLNEAIKEIGGELIEVAEVESDPVEDAIEYFYEEGINEEGIDQLIEEIGLEEFVNFVDGGGVVDLNEERSARRASVRAKKFDVVKKEVDKADAARKKAKKGEYAPSYAKKETDVTVYDDKPAAKKPAAPKKVASPKKPAAPKKAATPKKPAAPKKPVVKKVEKAVAKVKQTQPVKKPSRKGLGDRIRSAYKAGVKRHRKATQVPRVFAKGAVAGAKKAVKFAKDVKKVVSEEELNERLGGKGYSRSAMKSSIHPPSRQSSGDWEDSDRGAGNKAARRAGKKVEKKSPTYKAHVLNKEEVQLDETLPLRSRITSVSKADMAKMELDDHKRALQKRVDQSTKNRGDLKKRDAGAMARDKMREKDSWYTREGFSDWRKDLVEKKKQPSVHDDYYDPMEDPTFDPHEAEATRGQSGRGTSGKMNVRKKYRVKESVECDCNDCGQDPCVKCGESHHAVNEDLRTREQQIQRKQLMLDRQKLQIRRRSLGKKQETNADAQSKNVIANEGVMRLLGRKKKEKKAEKAMDAGARAKRKLARKIHAKYVSGSEDNVPDDIREDKALDIVRANIIKKHGKGAIYDPKRDAPTEAQKKANAEARKKRAEADKKAFADRAKKAGYKNPQDYANVVARYGSEDNMRKGRGLGT